MPSTWPVSSPPPSPPPRALGAAQTREDERFPLLAGNFGRHHEPTFHRHPRVPDVCCHERQGLHPERRGGDTTLPPGIRLVKMDYVDHSCFVVTSPLSSRQLRSNHFDKFIKACTEEEVTHADGSKKKRTQVVLPACGMVYNSFPRTPFCSDVHLAIVSTGPRTQGRIVSKAWTRR